jgi:hypothetical protein
MEQVLLEILLVDQLVKKFPLFLHEGSLLLYLVPNLTQLRPVILIVYYHLCLGIPTDLFPSALPSKIVYAVLGSSICVACPAHLILLDLTTIIIFHAGLSGRAVQGT